MTLSVLISTIDSGIDKIKGVLLPYRPDVKYIVSHQFTEEKFKIIPIELKRDDVIVSQIPGKGVTKSRNNAIRLADGDIGLFSDDDVTYTNEYLDFVIKAFTENPDLDVAIFKIKTPEGEPEYKKYPELALKLEKLPFSIGTIEIAFRVEKIKKKHLWFDERFGAGQPLLIGSDESIFVLDCIKAGLNVWFYPIYVVNHPYESTSKLIPRFHKKKVSVGGAFDARMNGWISIPKAFGATLKIIPDLLRNRKNPFVYLFQRVQAASYILLTKPPKENNNLEY